ncbi:metal-sensitive transcriptional regulator [Facklamia miroungae]|uniref:DNA-binding transcriptional regulator, FrmR family n=1 Tax=Facklamia miroungae TaxID=120956 RepID=A0A1G7STM9_9LACT|nr:metal-sensitive transcriptional regulator [Facklamia miroungae]NKZ29540.1 metal-sensitive transcriptional regulator [Facklamia miroungae]SDG26405.1 DNA-binding transcriptional regulator, FrmR family [Facklamia miroungae]
MDNKVEKKKIINRLKRSEGQLRGIQKMIEHESDCMDIITQLSAVRSSVDRVIGLVIVENLKNCLYDSEVDKELRDRRLEQALSLIIRK